MTTQQYHIDGMSCAACSSAVERVTRKLNGVESSNVNLTTNRMVITYDESQVTPEMICEKVSKAGFSASLIFYDSMLSDVTEPERMDQVSSHGYAWGYIGSCIPFALCLGLVLGAERIGLTMTAAIMLSLWIIALWWLLLSLPLLRSYRQRYFVERRPARWPRVSAAWGTPWQM